MVHSVDIFREGNILRTHLGFKGISFGGDISVKDMAYTDTATLASGTIVSDDGSPCIAHSVYKSVGITHSIVLFYLPQ